MTRQNQITMNFIRDHHDVMVVTDFSKSRKFIFRPNPTHRIMGITKNRKFDIRSFRLGFQIIKIYLVMVAVQFERIANHLSIVIDYGERKRVVHRSLNQNPFTGLSKLSDNQMQRRHNSDRRHDPVLINKPSMTPLYPIRHCRQITWCFAGIAINATFDSMLKCSDDGLGHAKIHIGHPHRQHAILTEIRVGAVPRLGLAVPHNELPFQGAQPSMIPFSIKIYCHSLIVPVAVTFIWANPALNLLCSKTAGRAVYRLSTNFDSRYGQN